MASGTDVINQLRWQIDQVDVRHPLDLPIQEVELSIALLVAGRPHERQVPWMYVDLDAPAHGRHRHVDPDFPTVRQAQLLELGFDGDTPSQQALQHQQLWVGVDRTTDTTSIERVQELRRPWSTGVAQTTSDGTQFLRITATISQHLVDDRPQRRRGQFGGQIEEQARPGRNDHPVVQATSIEGADLRGLPQRDARFHIGTAAVRHTQLDGDSASNPAEADLFRNT